MTRPYRGIVLWVDLTTGITTEEEIPEPVYRQVLSGLGLAAYLLYREIPARADPFGPDNILAFASGVLVGTDSLFSGRWVVAGKSPLTGTWGEANCGGTLAAAIKRCGYDAILLRGTSPQPVVLHVHDRHARLLPAGELWGADTIETDRHLRRQFPQASVACIGPAGEKRSLIAAICNDSGRLAARSGLGAVMGAKQVKALVLQGSHTIGVEQPQAMRRWTKHAYHWTKLTMPLPPGKVTRFVGTLMRVLPLAWRQDGMLYKWLLRRWGTISMNQISVEMGDAPVKNWRGTNEDFPPQRSARIDPDRITTLQTKRYHCRSCPLACGGIVEHHQVGQSHKPEYETVMAWGGLLLNDDLDSIFVINELLNRAGMDSISAGAAVAFALECAEKGLFTAEELSDLDLRWGNAAAIRAVVEQMIERRGIGALLADGSKAAAGHLRRRGQPEAAEYAVHAGGQELAMHDGRNDPGFALHAVVEPMPGRHTNGSHLYYEMFQLWRKLPQLHRPPALYRKDRKYRAVEELAREAVACSRFSQILNGAGLCLFGAFMGVHRLPVFEWLNAAAGWSFTPQEYMEIGGRIQTIKQQFNAREGIPLRHTINPRALGLPPQKRGANRARTIDMDALVHAYWRESGWNPQTGLPGDANAVDLTVDKPHSPTSNLV